MDNYTLLYVAEEKTLVEKKVSAFLKLYEQRMTEGYWMPNVKIIGSFDVAVADGEDRTYAIERLEEDAELEKPVHDKAYRALLKKALKSKKTLILIEIELSVTVSKPDASQWACLFGLFSDDIVLDAPGGEEASFCKDLVEKYRKLQDIDMKTPAKVLSRPKAAKEVHPEPETGEDGDETVEVAAASQDSVWVDQIFQTLESIQENQEAVYAFKEFLSKASADQKTFLENLLRRKVQTDKDSLSLLRMERLAFQRFAAKLQKDLDQLL